MLGDRRVTLITLIKLRMLFTVVLEGLGSNLKFLVGCFIDHTHTHYSILHHEHNYYGQQL